jgi:hypothetical protein
MPNPIIKIHDLETGEEIERPMTNAEFAIWKKQQEEFTIG